MNNPATQHPIQPADLFQLRFLQSAALSPDGQQVAYSVATYDEETDTDTEQLWLLELATGTSRQLTFGKARDQAPQWSPDGSTLAFLSTRGDKPQLYLIAVDGGEARPLTQFPQGVSGGITWSPDGQQLAFSAGPQPDQPHDTSRPYRLTRHVYRFDAIGYLDSAVQDLYIIAATGGEAQRLTADGCHNTMPQWSPDGSRLLYTATMQPTTHRAITPELRVVTLSGTISTPVGHAWGNFAGIAAWLPDGARIAFVGVAKGQRIGTQNDLWVVDLAQGTIDQRTSGLDRQVGARLQPDMPAAVAAQLGKIYVTAATTDAGESAYVPVQIGGTVQIYQVQLSGATSYRAVLHGDRSCFLLGWSAATDNLLYAVSDFLNPPDLYTANGNGEYEQQLTQLNAPFLAERQQPVIEPLWFPGKDGVNVEGWLIRPAGATAPSPTILYIHGGPHSAFGSVYHFDTQMLVGAGYAVLLINHRASTGYGNAFSTAIKGDWGNLDYTDLMAGVDTVIAKGWADPERLGVCGLSGGGNLSCWIVGQTHRFKAAVPENPVTNWHSFYGVSDIGVWFAVEELGGHPHEIPEIYTRCSPITYAHRCQTPTLLVQGEHDWRCPAEQAEQFYTILKVNGCPVEMVRLPAMPHGGAISGPPKVRRAQNEALLAWMNRYVKTMPSP
ncbi:MAG: S9 family peptidase [Caldilineaceae bacterium]|nr:S9 family peptidase [Caldilineaceae bacterium]